MMKYWVLKSLVFCVVSLMCYSASATSQNDFYENAGPAYDDSTNQLYYPQRSRRGYAQPVPQQQRRPEPPKPRAEFIGNDSLYVMPNSWKNFAPGVDDDRNSAGKYKAQSQFEGNDSLYTAPRGYDFGAEDYITRQRQRTEVIERPRRPILNTDRDYLSPGELARQRPPRQINPAYTSPYDNNSNDALYYPLKPLPGQAPVATPTVDPGWSGQGSVYDDGVSPYGDSGGDHFYPEYYDY